MLFGLNDFERMLDTLGFGHFPRSIGDPRQRIVDAYEQAWPMIRRAYSERACFVSTNGRAGGQYSICQWQTIRMGKAAYRSSLSCSPGLPMHGCRRLTVDVWTQLQELYKDFPTSKRTATAHSDHQFAGLLVQWLERKFAGNFTGSASRSRWASRIEAKLNKPTVTSST